MLIALIKPVLGQIDQGSIFTCGLAEDYPECRALSLIITARCDIAQKKAPVFNYLPIVSVDDWLHRDGRIILCDRLSKSVLGSMKGVLKQAGHSDSVLETESPVSILDKLFPEGDGKAKKLREQFKKLVDQRDRIETCENSLPKDHTIVELGELFRGERNALLNELTSQRLNGYYFLPNVEDGGDNKGYVVLLREVRHIPRSLAGVIGRGMSKEEYEAASKTRADYVGRLAFSFDDFAMPVGQLPSPHVEHLMQAFSALFSRIGLPDLGRDYVDGLWEMQPSIERGRR